MAHALRIGTTERPLRVAIVGAGPAGCHAAMALLDQRDIDIEVDLFDRLPTPYGLVRAGVAPDHQRVKTIVNVYARLGQDPRFAFFGNVEFGRDISVATLANHYDQVLVATGNEGDRRLGIPGEHLKGCTPASVFVGWYNGHPDYRHAEFDLSCERVAIVGNGNVAIDVARMLARAPESLRTTDIADHALRHLRLSKIREIVILGRRGPLQAAFAPAELRELLELPNVSPSVVLEELILDEDSQNQLAHASAKSPERRNFDLLRNIPNRAAQAHERTVSFRFLASPVEFAGDERGRLQSLLLRRNRLIRDQRGLTVASAADGYEELAVGLALVSVGFEGRPIADLPFDADRRVIANVDGRIVRLETGEHLPGLYCSGWARTGPRGLIATQKTGSAEVVGRMMEDFRAGCVPLAPRAGRDATIRSLDSDGIRWVSFDDWNLIDGTEIARGKARGAPRSKLVDVGSMLDLIEMQRRGW